MAYDTTGLNWVKHFSELDEAEQKVLIALSHDKWRWRTRTSLQKVTRLEPSGLDRTLSSLLERNIISGGLGENGELIFALAERLSLPGKFRDAKPSVAQPQYSKA